MISFKLLTFFTSLVICFSFLSCQKEISKIGSFTDPRDGEVYSTIELGDQTWMSENLRYNNSNYCSTNPKIGCFYSFYSANNLVINSDICPDGWHIPSKEEWEVLINNYEAIDLASVSEWNSYSVDTMGTNRSGFNVFPTGYNYRNPIINPICPKCLTSFWSSTLIQEELPFKIHYSFTIDILNGDFETSIHKPSYRPSEVNYNCRCLKD